jgi:osmoprotectant transport system permease protein
MSKLIIPPLILLLAVSFGFSNQDSTTIKIGSKKFTESVILGSLATQLVRDIYPKVEHLKELGGTRILWNALIRGEIDIYPEYTGTIIQEILADKHIKSAKDLPVILNSYGISISKPLGFNNTYALGMNNKRAKELNIHSISDLINFPDLKFGFTNEFMDRKDGWPSLKQFYQLPQTNVVGLDHDLAYRGIASGAIDVTDLYTTDADIEYYHLAILKDDKHFFPEYYAVYLYKSEIGFHYPKVVNALKKLEGEITEQEMIQMNEKVKIYGKSENAVAAEFIREKFGLSTKYQKTTFSERLWQTTVEHLTLVTISLIAAVLIAIPLGILSFRFTKLGQIILAIVGIIQTVPSLALIVFMIPLLGIGAEPAIVALFLYSLLPIVRNTNSGLNDIPNSILESAQALGLPSLARLRLIELPLASRSILSGIKTSAVINIGTATLGALIGAGGYGQPILTGIRLDNINLILEGAVPAAVLALLTQGIFELSERYLVPRGLRIKSEI